MAQTESTKVDSPTLGHSITLPSINSLMGPESDNQSLLDAIDHCSTDKLRSVLKRMCTEIPSVTPMLLRELGNPAPHAGTLPKIDSLLNHEPNGHQEYKFHETTNGSKGLATTTTTDSAQLLSSIPQKRKAVDEDEDEDEPDNNHSTNGTTPFDNSLWKWPNDETWATLDIDSKRELLESIGSNKQPQHSPPQITDSTHPLCTNCNRAFIPNHADTASCIYHSGWLEDVDDGDIWADHDEDVHGEIDSDELRRAYPSFYRWNCCDTVGTSPGCVSGTHAAEPGDKSYYARLRSTGFKY